MRELPTGTVTFLFTDIEGSTRLLQELGDRYAEALTEHRRALRGPLRGTAASRSIRRATHSSSPSRRPRTRWRRHATAGTLAAARVEGRELDGEEAMRKALAVD